MKDQHVTGLSLAVSKQGRLVFAKSYGYANKATGEELCPNHSMRVMSVSKPITACGAMKLYMQNANLLDRHVFGPNSILGSSFSTPSGQQKLNNITVRQLLSHTSGLRTCNGESVFWDKTKTKADAMNVLLGMGDLLQFDPNTKYNYSNTNFFILSLVIEKLSGQSYETFIRQQLLAPAGIGNTMYVGAANGSSGSGEVSYTPAKSMNLQLWAGFGGWVARPMDLLRLLSRVDGNTPPADLLSSDAHTQMTTGTSLNMGYGLGWLVSGNQQSHNGCYGGTRSFLVELPGGLSYAVIINNNPDNDGCGWTMKGKIEPAVQGVSAWPSYDLF
jgi:CubicO group peptidase (beta-lactamase class C family)